MTTKSATRSRPRLVETSQDRASTPSDAVQRERDEVLALMLADIDRRLDAIESRTDRIIARAA